jgi:hypothetical protein
MARLPLLEATVRSLMGRPSSPPASEGVWVYDGAPSEDGRSTPRGLRVRRQVLQPTPGLLTDAEIVRALRRFRYDPEFRGPKRVPFRVLAELTGLSHVTLYEAMRPDMPMRPNLPLRPGRISELTRAKVSPAIAAILEGQLRFRRRKQIWVVEGSVLKPQR